MSCGLFDLACYAQGAVDGLVTWVLSFFSFNTLVMLWIGTAIGAKWGWPALIAETLGIFLLLRRNAPDEPTETDLTGESVFPQVRKSRPVRKPTAGKRTRTIFDMFGRK